MSYLNSAFLLYVGLRGKIGFPLSRLLFYLYYLEGKYKWLSMYKAQFPVTSPVFRLYKWLCAYIKVSYMSIY